MINFHIFMIFIASNIVISIIQIQPITGLFVKSKKSSITNIKRSINISHKVYFFNSNYSFNGFIKIKIT